MDTYSKYTVESTIKQLLLLEEHLKNNKCQDCIVKHCFHILGLCDEGVHTDYYQLFESVKELIIGILEHLHDDSYINQIVTQLRSIRKELVRVWIDRNAT